MFLRYISLLAGMLLLGLPAAAQDTLPPDNTDEPTFRSYHLIEDAEIVVPDEDDAEAILQLAGSLPDGCEFDTQFHTQRIGSAIIVDIYRDLPLAAACPMILKLFETEVNIHELLFTLDDDETLPSYLVVNDQLYRLNYAQIEPMPGADTMPVVPPLLTPVDRENAIIDSIEMDTDSETIQLTITGRRGGCDVPELFRFRPDVDSETVFRVEAFQGIPPETACTRNIVQFTHTIDTGIAVNPDESSDDADSDDDTPAAETFNFVPADTSLPQASSAPADDDDSPDRSDSEDTMQVMTVIEDVQVAILESFPMQISLEITGFQPDGCDVPVIVDETLEDDTVTVEIYRNVPADVMCPMNIVPYEDTIILESTFEGGTITINVNGTVKTVDL